VLGSLEPKSNNKYLNIKQIMETPNFLEQCIAILKGDDAKVISLKVQKKSKSILNSQISNKKTTCLDLEDVIEEKTEALNLAVVNNAAVIKDNKEYIKTLLEAEKARKEAVQALEDKQAEIIFLESCFARAKAGKFPTADKGK